MIKLTDLLREMLDEKKADRCKRIADRRYDKPSAYKSGAIVRCRKGKIWKDIKEEIDQLEELNIQQKTKLGSGDSAEGETYDLKLSPDKVVKKYTLTNPETKYAQYDLMKKYPEFFVKVYKVTPKYVVLEKVKVPISGLEELQQFIKNDLNINFVRGNANNNRYAGEVVHAIYSELKDNKNDMFMSILNRVKQKGKTNLAKLLVKIHNFLLNLINKVPEINKYWLDIGADNIGEDKQGNLKLFDIMYEEEWADDNEDEDDDEDELDEAKKETLRTWFKRKGAPGKTGGWVDCNTCREVDGKKKCKPCGRQKGEKRSKYPSCRPTPSQCSQPGKGKKWGKTK
jgi:hypothetical protein